MIQRRRVAALLFLLSTLSMVANGFNFDILSNVGSFSKKMSMMKRLIEAVTSSRMVISPIRYTECPNFKSQDNFYINYDTMGGESRYNPKDIQRDDQCVITIEG